MFSMLSIFGYFDNHMKHQIICDAKFLDNHVEAGVDLSWLGIYHDSVEYLPPDIPDPRGDLVNTTTFVDAYHSQCIETSRSINEVLIIFNKTSIEFYINHINIVETFTYRLEVLSTIISTGITIEICKNMSGHALMGRQADRLETMALVFSLYVVVCIVCIRQ